MQSDVHHVLPENAAWHYMGSTCANSPTVFSFLISVTFLSFLLLSPVQQAQAEAGLPCAGHMQDRLGITLWTTWQKHAWGQREGKDGGEQIGLMRAEHKQKQEEGRGRM